MALSIYFRHERVRDAQKQLIGDVMKCLEEKKHLVAHAPTGLGKTDSSLAPAITYALENDKTIFFCTPKISQHEIAMEAARKTAEKYELSLTALDIVGKRHLCLDETLKDRNTDDMYEICRKRKRDEKCPYYGFARGYNAMQKQKSKVIFDNVREWYGNGKQNTELATYCANYKEGSRIAPPCAYEMALQIGDKARVIICDYHHVLNPHISANFFEKLNKKLEDSIFIIDEAHNVPDRIRNAMSVSIDEKMLMKAENEAMSIGNKPLANEILEIGRDFRKAEKNLNEDERIFRKDEIPVKGMDFLNELNETGMVYLETSDKNASNCFRLLRFYENWMKDSNAYLRIIKRNDFGTKVSYKCLDPSVVTRDTLNSVHSAIIMSGTLKPGEMYRDLLGLDPERAIVKEYPSPFPKENQLNMIIKSVTTKFESRGDEEFDKIALKTSQIVNEVPGNSAVFFPSYSMMRSIIPRMSFNKKIICQEDGDTPEDVHKKIVRFKKAKEEGAVLCGVTGGSFSEGIDFPGAELLAAVVIGIPLAEPDLETQAIIRYYDMKFGKGWEYGYYFPAMSKAVQAAGRVIRDEKDRGVVAFLDDRFSWRKYSQCFPSNYSFVITENPGNAVKEFWAKRKDSQKS